MSALLLLKETMSRQFFSDSVKQKQERYTKSTLPEKPCEHCQRPMAWRKSWAKNWENVKYCSDRCQAEAKQKRQKSKSS
jgi:hypothetical protein